MMLTRTRLSAVALASSVALVVTGCGGGKQKTESKAASDGSISCEFSDGQLSMATGNSTGVYYLLGGGIANLLTEKSGGKLKVTAAETGASVQNIQQIVTGDYDIAFSLADTAADAVNGKGAFEGKKADIKALASTYANYTQVVVRKDAGIKSIADMKGKKISTGSPKSGTEVIATRLLQTAGINIDSDLTAQRLDLTKTIDGMKDGSLDGFVWSGGLPTPALTDLFTSKGDAVEFLDIMPALKKMQEINEVYAEGTIPKATYNLPADVKTIVVPNLLVVSADFPDSNACAITKTIFENKADLAKVHPSANEFDPKKAVETDPVPLNDGAKKALEDLG
ncbi:TAXI family TRAP transporter solute-binding subunit [Cumulibacter manganitolerans]|uniref:TAXI family TRAP transporter solute-binding subunit n=1 Tax=Cumulibacter manganitolerans TaxID=1884992 RepID=UPI001E599416|nr:TAXI family TRAP transporter solute-binding subunit [Cumulibacter manganitolerans]